MFSFKATLNRIFFFSCFKNLEILIVQTGPWGWGHWCCELVLSAFWHWVGMAGLGGPLPLFLIFKACFVGFNNSHVEFVSWEAGGSGLVSA